MAEELAAGGARMLAADLARPAPRRSWSESGQRATEVAERASFITGSYHLVDGGYTAQ